MLALPAGGKTDVQINELIGRRKVDIDRHTDGEEGGRYRQAYRWGEEREDRQTYMYMYR